MKLAISIMFSIILSCLGLVSLQSNTTATTNPVIVNEDKTLAITAVVNTPIYEYHDFTQSYLWSFYVNEDRIQTKAYIKVKMNGRILHGTRTYKINDKPVHIEWWRDNLSEVELVNNRLTAYTIFDNVDANEGITYER